MCVSDGVWILLGECVSCFCVFGVCVCVGVFGFWVLFLDVIRIRHLL